MDLNFYVRVRTCKKRVTGKQPLLLNPNDHFLTKKIRGHVYIHVATHNVKSTLYVVGFHVSSMLSCNMTIMSKVLKTQLVLIK